MAKALIDLDEDALARAKVFYRTDTTVETVNRALRDAAARQEREGSRFPGIDAGNGRQLG